MKIIVFLLLVSLFNISFSQEAIPNSNIKSTLKIGKKIPISWDTMDCHALDA